MRTWFIIALLCACPLVAAAQPAPDTLIIGTAKSSGTYYKVGLALAKVCSTLAAHENKPASFPILRADTTEGSTNNVRLLQEGAIQLAIVQNDIAFLAEHGQLDDKTDKDDKTKKIDVLRGIAMLYLEPIYIITINDSSIATIDSLKDLNISILPRDSGTSRNAKTILEAVHLWEYMEDKNQLVYERADNLLLLKDSIQAVFVNTISEPLEKGLRDGRLKLLSLPDEVIEDLTQEYPYFTRYETERDGQPFKTVSVKSMLVAHKDLDADVAYAVTQWLTETLYRESSSSEKKPQPSDERDRMKAESEDSLKRVLSEEIRTVFLRKMSARSKKDNLILKMPLRKWHPGAARYYQKIDLLHNDIIMQIVWILMGLIVVALGLCLGANYVLYSSNWFTTKVLYRLKKVLNRWRRLNEIINFVHTLIIRYKYIFLLIFIVTIFLTSIELVQIFEASWAIKENEINKFGNRGVLRNLIWMFVFGASGYEDSLFPQSPLGKIFATLVPLVGIGGLLALVGLLTSDHIKKRMVQAKGMQTTKMNKHIIVCGWNQNVPFLVENLLHKNISHKRSVVILADPDEEMPIEHYKLNEKMVSFVRGSATQRNDLERANLAEADIALIVAEENTPDPDARTILKVLTIESYCKELEERGLRKRPEQIRTIVEIKNASNRRVAEDAKAKEIIALGHIKSKIFVQSVLNPGVASFVEEILTFNDKNDIYSHVIGEDSSLVDQTFDDLLVKLRKFRILLLSIKKRKSVDGLRELITNPLDDDESNYQTRAGDRLIVLAREERVVKEAVANIERAK